MTFKKMSRIERNENLWILNIVENSNTNKDGSIIKESLKKYDANLYDKFSKFVNKTRDLTEQKRFYMSDYAGKCTSISKTRNR